MNQKIKLYEWVKDHKDLIERDGWSLRRSSDEASKDLGFKITTGNLSGITYSRKGEPAVRVNWRRSSTAGKRRDAIKAMAITLVKTHACLQDMAKNLGMDGHVDMLELSDQVADDLSYFLNTGERDG